MQTIEVPREQWGSTLDGFSKIHEGWLISVDVSAPDIGAQPEIHELPLVGVTSEPPDRGNDISIAVARTATDHITHIIQRPRRLWLERTEDGADAALEIEASDGSKTILSFTHPARPADVDGLPRGMKMPGGDLEVD